MSKCFRNILTYKGLTFSGSYVNEKCYKENFYFDKNHRPSFFITGDKLEEQLGYFNIIYKVTTFDPDTNYTVNDNNILCGFDYRKIYKQVDIDYIQYTDKNYILYQIKKQGIEYLIKNNLYLKFSQQLFDKLSKVSPEAKLLNSKSTKQDVKNIIYNHPNLFKYLNKTKYHNDVDLCLDFILFRINSLENI